MRYVDHAREMLCGIISSFGFPYFLSSY